MAKYTELFASYIESGGELPPQFDEIDGFAELFTLRYFDCEIGFETEEEFRLKLFGRAKLLIPTYKARLTALETALGELTSPSKVITRETNDDPVTSYNYELPMNAETVDPSQKSIDGARKRVEETVDTGFTIDEAARLFDVVTTSEKWVIKSELLEAFSNLFMKVY